MSRKTDYFCTDSIREDLKGKTVRGGVATGVSQAVSLGVQLATIPILSRLLAPEDFGLIAMVTVFTGFAEMFVDAGLSTATVQREDITHKQVSNLFWVAAGLGLGIAAVTAALSPVIAWFYGDPRLAPVTIALAAPFLISGLTIQHQALLRRTMQFHKIGAIKVCAAVLSQAVAIWLAWKYESYWALVARDYSIALTALVLSWVAVRWRPGWPSRGAGTKPLIKFGANLAGARALNFYSRNGDYLLIGWYWGSELLGFYERAYKLLLFPIQRSNVPITNVLVPALSRLVHKRERYRRVYYSAVSWLTAATMPVVVYAAAEADRLIPLVLGAQWADSVPIFRALAPAAVIVAANVALSWVFISFGNGARLLRWQVLVSMVILPAMAAGLPWGPVGVAVAYSAARFALLPIGCWICFRDTHVTIGGYARAVAPNCAFALLAGAIALGARHVVPGLGEATIASCAAHLLVFLGAYVGLWLLANRSKLVRMPPASAREEGRTPPSNAVGSTNGRQNKL